MGPCSDKVRWMGDESGIIKSVKKKTDRGSQGQGKRKDRQSDGEKDWQQSGNSVKSAESHLGC